VHEQHSAFTLSLNGADSDFICLITTSSCFWKQPFDSFCLFLKCITLALSHLHKFVCIADNFPEQMLQAHKSCSQKHRHKLEAHGHISSAQKRC